MRVRPCWRIAPNSSLQDFHAFVLDEEPWFDSSTGSSLAAAHGAVTHDLDYVDSKNTLAACGLEEPCASFPDFCVNRRFHVVISKNF
jgi:hypothetical protein